MRVINFTNQKAIRFVLFLLTILFVVPFAYSQTQSSDKVAIDFIAGQAKKEKADEYPDARKILRGDINKDGKEDLVVLYTLEGFGGGNMHIQYLAVFLGNGKTFVYANHTSVGGKNNRSVDLDSIKNGTINLSTLKYLPSDPSCCPSKKGNAHFILSRGKLKEV